MYWCCPSPDNRGQVKSCQHKTKDLSCGVVSNACTAVVVVALAAAAARGGAGGSVLGKWAADLERRRRGYRGR